MTSSRILLKPKVRVTEMNSLNSTIICETEDEMDEEMNDLKIIVKPKGQNSRNNYNETSSDIGNIDEHYTDSTYYDTQNAILTMRNTIKNVRSSDSSSFSLKYFDIFVLFKVLLIELGPENFSSLSFFSSSLLSGLLILILIFQLNFTPAIIFLFYYI